MEDKTVLIGFTGSIASWTISQWSDLFGLCAGILTCVYLIVKLFKLLRKR